MPPAASALMVIFSRNHNRIAKEILKRNERGRWQQDPSGPRMVGRIGGDRRCGQQLTPVPLALGKVDHADSARREVGRVVRDRDDIVVADGHPRSTATLGERDRALVP